MTAPGSLWIFRCLVPPEDRGEAFDLQDSIPTPILGIRLGEVAIVADFLDCGILAKAILPSIVNIQRLRLTPKQFIEVFVRISYKASTLGLYTSVRAVTSADGQQMLSFEPESTIEGDNDFREWNEQDYAVMLASRLGMRIEDVMNGDGTARSWIYDGNGNIGQYSF